MSPKVSTWSSSAAARRRRVLAALALLAACASPVQQYALNDLRLSCDDANRTTYKALTALGFSVTSFTPAAMGRAGEAHGTRDAQRANGGAQNVTITIACGPTGAAVDAHDDDKLLGQVEFKRAFFLSFTSTQHMDERRREMEEKVAAGTAPASQQPQGLQVKIEPVRGQASKLDFEMDMAAAGILPVRVRVTNATSRIYRVAADDVQLVGRDRARVPPLSVAAAAARVMKSSDASGKPLTALSEAELVDRLGKALFTTTRIDARSDSSGYLFFPLGDYARARMLVTDTETEEAEGFAVEF
jgi:hypothetical protein